MKKLLCICIICILAFVGCSSKDTFGQAEYQFDPDLPEDELEYLEFDTREFGDILVDRGIVNNGSMTSEIRIDDENMALFYREKEGSGAVAFFDGNQKAAEFVLYHLCAEFCAENDGLFLAMYGGLDSESYEFLNGEIQDPSDNELGERYEGFELEEKDEKLVIDLTNAYEAATGFMVK